MRNDRQVYFSGGHKYASSMQQPSVVAARKGNKVNCVIFAIISCFAAVGMVISSIGY